MGETTDKNPTRRGFLTGALALTAMTAAGLCLCSLVGCKKRKASTPVIPKEFVQIKSKSITVDVANVDALKPVGGSAKIVDSNLRRQVIVIHAARNRYVALSNRCTHRGAEVEYSPKDRALKCVNYGHSTFRLSGQVVRGPASKPLKTYNVLFFEGKLEVFL